MKTEITIQQPLAGGPWAYMVTRDNRPLAWGEAATKRQALDEAATAVDPKGGAGQKRSAMNKEPNGCWEFIKIAFAVVVAALLAKACQK